MVTGISMILTMTLMSDVPDMVGTGNWIDSMTMRMVLVVVVDHQARMEEMKGTRMSLTHPRAMGNPDHAILGEAATPASAWRGEIQDPLALMWTETTEEGRRTEVVEGTLHLVTRGRRRQALEGRMTDRHRHSVTRDPRRQALGGTVIGRPRHLATQGPRHLVLGGTVTNRRLETHALLLKQLAAEATQDPHLVVPDRKQSATLHLVVPSNPARHLEVHHETPNQWDHPLLVVAAVVQEEEVPRHRHLRLPLGILYQWSRLLLVEAAVTAPQETSHWFLRLPGSQLLHLPIQVDLEARWVLGQRAAVRLLDPVQLVEVAVRQALVVQQGAEARHLDQALVVRVQTAALHRSAPVLVAQFHQHRVVAPHLALAQVAPRVAAHHLAPSQMGQHLEIHPLEQVLEE
jgi:hypothetical protein